MKFTWVLHTFRFLNTHVNYNFFWRLELDSPPSLSLLLVHFRKLNWIALNMSEMNISHCFRKVYFRIANLIVLHRAFSIDPRLSRIPRYPTTRSLIEFMNNFQLVQVTNYNVINFDKMTYYWVKIIKRRKCRVINKDKLNNG